MAVEVMLLLLAGGAAMLSKKKGGRAGGTKGACPSPKEAEGFLVGYKFRHEMIGGANPTDRVPVIVYFHARGVEPNIPRSFPSVNLPARVIMPFANKTNDKGNPIWFQGRAADADQEALAKEMAAQAPPMEAFLSAVRQCYPGAPLILTGYSQGGMMTLLMGSRGLSDALVPVSAWLPRELWPDQPIFPPMNAVHGASDMTIPSDRSRAMYEEFSRAGNSVHASFIAEQEGHGTKLLPWSATLNRTLS